MGKYLHILDNGHGKETEGKRSPHWPNGTQLFEYEFNRAIVKLVAEGLAKEGIDHHILVPELVDVPLGDRTARANALAKSKNQKTVFYSVHANAAIVPEASGIEVFTSKGKTKSDDVAEVLLQELGVLSPGIRMRLDLSDGDADKEANFFVLRNTSMPATLLELGFMTNRDECSLLLNPLYRKILAGVIVKAIKRVDKELEL
jgi:N-acetylmuramoyl-L-alanine amidase